MNIYFESGIRNINDLAKRYKEAEIYFHRDMDGVTSAIAIKHYLRTYDISVINVYPIEYGSMEYAIPKGQLGVLKVLVDFAHGKIMMNIHTDHHDSQIGVSKEQSTSFVKTPSNLEYISSSISPNQIFPPEDAKFISMIDSANYAKNSVTPDEVIQVMFKVDKTKPLELNKRQQAFVVNKLLLAFKGTKNFLRDLVMASSPSIQSMFVTITNLINEKSILKPGMDVKEKLKSILDVSGESQNYEKAQAELKLGQQDIDTVLTLGAAKDGEKNGKAGQSMLAGNLLIQYGSSPLWGAKKYDRYMAFKLNPEAEYFCMIWPLGLIQVSKNPFKKGMNPISLGDLILGKGKGLERSGGIIDKFKPQLQNMMVSLYSLKKNFESDIQKFKRDAETLKEGESLTYSDSIGFTADDFVALFKGCRIQGLKKTQGWKDVIRAITNVKMHNLVETEKEKKPGERKTTDKVLKQMTVKEVYPKAEEKEIGGNPATIQAVDMLKKIYVPLWDIIMVNSGGHKDITNLSGLSFYSYATNNDAMKYTDFLRKIAHEIAQTMKDMKLVSEETNESFDNFLKG